MAGKDLKISLVTPSFNQGQYLDQTIKSVLGQNYPQLEYLVMDGGSTDGTLNLLKNYSKQIKWISQKDIGQSDALNQGFRKTSGEIVGFINSDDYFLPGSLDKVSAFFRQNPQALWLTGKCKTVDVDNQEVRQWVTAYKNLLLKFFPSRSTLSVVNFISQPATFWRREIFAAVGFFDTSLNYSMDYDFWLRIYRQYPLYFLDDYLAAYRVHPSSKAVRSPESQFEAEYQISKKYTDSALLMKLHRLHYRAAIFLYRKLFIKKAGVSK